LRVCKSSARVADVPCTWCVPVLFPSFLPSFHLLTESPSVSQPQSVCRRVFSALSSSAFPIPRCSLVHSRPTVVAYAPLDHLGIPLSSLYSASMFTSHPLFRLHPYSPEGCCLRCASTHSSVVRYKLDRLRLDPASCCRACPVLPL